MEKSCKTCRWSSHNNRKGTLCSAFRLSIGLNNTPACTSNRGLPYFQPIIKPGDKVIVLPDAYLNHKNDSDIMCAFPESNHGMMALLGQVVTISKVKCFGSHREAIHYKIEEDKGRWAWSEAWLQSGIVKNDEPKADTVPFEPEADTVPFEPEADTVPFAPGDKVIILPNAPNIEVDKLFFAESMFDYLGQPTTIRSIELHSSGHHFTLDIDDGCCAWHPDWLEHLTQKPNKSTAAKAAPTTIHMEEKRTMKSVTNTLEVQKAMTVDAATTAITVGKGEVGIKLLKGQIKRFLTPEQALFLDTAEGEYLVAQAGSFLLNMSTDMHGKPELATNIAAAMLTAASVKEVQKFDIGGLIEGMAAQMGLVNLDGKTVEVPEDSAKPAKAK